MDTLTAAVRAHDVVGEPLYAEVAGIAVWTGQWPQRRIACRSCRRKFLPYVVEPGDKQPALMGFFTACPSCGVSRDRKFTSAREADGRMSYAPIPGTGWWDAEFVGLRTRIGKSICAAPCVGSASDECTCSCRGANHGTYA